MATNYTKLAETAFSSRPERALLQLAYPNITAEGYNPPPPPPDAVALG